MKVVKKRSKALSNIKPVENISKNLQRFVEISPAQKEVLILYKLQDHREKGSPYFK